MVRLTIVIVKTADGKIIMNFIEPGYTLTKKYDSKTIDIQVVYQANHLPKPTFKLIQFIKGKITQIENENGTLKKRELVGLDVRG